jgi:type II secretory pathway predicted ATPase ExeA
MKNPLVDVAAILICILAVVLIGQYYIHKKDKEMSLQQIEKRVGLKEQPKVNLYSFEYLSKRTE